VNEDPDQRVMYVGDFANPEAPFCCQSINRQLHYDDIAAAQYVYGIRGDFNRDEQVNAADYTTWRNTLGGSVTPGTGADANVDGSIDELDYASWKAHFGDVRLAGFGEQESFGAANSVPEPSNWLCSIIACPILGERARARSKRCRASCDHSV
jgi:hypothetical protein